METMDDLYVRARSVAKIEGKVSVSMLQRRLTIGYTIASRLMDLLDENHQLGPAKKNTALRDYILNPEYMKIAERRIFEVAPLFMET